MQKRLTLTLVASLLTWETACAQGAGDGQVGLSRQAREALSLPTFANRYVLVTHLTPTHLQGDFNGDGKIDTAVLLKQRSTGKIGIGIVHGGSVSPIVLGAGDSFGNGGDDFAWMDVWRVQPEGPASPGTDGARPPDLKGDALLVEKAMSASALVYWSGTEYKWYQQGD